MTRFLSFTRRLSVKGELGFHGTPLSLAVLGLFLCDAGIRFHFPWCFDFLPPGDPVSAFPLVGPHYCSAILIFSLFFTLFAVYLLLYDGSPHPYCHRRDSSLTCPFSFLAPLFASSSTGVVSIFFLGR